VSILTHINAGGILQPLIVVNTEDRELVRTADVVISD